MTIRAYVKGKYVYQVTTEEVVERCYTVIADTPIEAIEAMTANHWEECEVTETLTQRVIECKELRKVEADHA